MELDIEDDEFFFSSRRRHTRLRRDWSSDVCSSDLWDENSKVLERFMAKELGKIAP